MCIRLQLALCIGMCWRTKETKQDRVWTIMTSHIAVEHVRGAVVM